MNLHDGALIASGAIGMGAAIFHGFVVQRQLIAPLGTSSSVRSTRRATCFLLHFSTFNWFASGMLLWSSSVLQNQKAQVLVVVLAASSFLYGAVGNFWATRARHPGWAVCAIVVVLATYGVIPALLQWR